MSDSDKDTYQKLYDNEAEGDIIDKSQPSVRPKDAATIILVRRDAEKPRILLGKRSSRHDFMPEKYVFPGGRVDPTDSRVKSACEYRQDVQSQLAFRTRRNTRAFGLTAIRELFEETGLILGQEGEQKGKAPQNWQTYFQQGALPTLSKLKFIGRAITPPYRPKRFDARFFIASAEDALLDERPANTTPELVDLKWVDLDEAAELDLPSVTRVMIQEARQHLHPDQPDPAPIYISYLRNQHHHERL